MKTLTLPSLLTTMTLLLLTGNASATDADRGQERACFTYRQQACRQGARLLNDLNLLKSEIAKPFTNRDSRSISALRESLPRQVENSNALIEQSLRCNHHTRVALTLHRDQRTQLLSIIERFQEGLDEKDLSELLEGLERNVERTDQDWCAANENANGPVR